RGQGERTRESSKLAISRDSAWPAARSRFPSAPFRPSPAELNWEAGAEPQKGRPFLDCPLEYDRFHCSRHTSVGGRHFHPCVLHLPDGARDPKRGERNRAASKGSARSARGNTGT